MKSSPGAPFKLSPELEKQLPWFQERLLSWFETYRRNFPWREPGKTSYEIVISEILLQRTTATAIAAFLPTFIENFPSWESLAAASTDELQALLKPLGLWKQKSLIFKSLAYSIIEKTGQIPCSRDELEQLPGIGQYIAGAVMLVLCGLAEPLLDATMARVLERFFGPRQLVDIRYDPYLQVLSHKVVEHRESLAVNWAILDLGALVCKPQNPLCPDCPVKSGCKFFLISQGSK